MSMTTRIEWIGRKEHQGAAMNERSESMIKIFLSLFEYASLRLLFLFFYYLGVYS